MVVVEHSLPGLLYTHSGDPNTVAAFVLVSEQIPHRLAKVWFPPLPGRQGNFRHAPEWTNMADVGFHIVEEPIRCLAVVSRRQRPFRKCMNVVMAFAQKRGEDPSRPRWYECLRLWRRSTTVSRGPLR